MINIYKTRQVNRFGDDIDTICGDEDESQQIEQYDGSLGVTVDFVKFHQTKVGQIQWNDNLHEKYTNPGNLNGRRWMSPARLKECCREPGMMATSWCGGTEPWFRASKG